MSKFISRFQKKDDRVIKELKSGGAGFPFNMGFSIPALLDLLKDPNAIDDRKMLLEHILVHLSGSPNGRIQRRLERGTVELLYNDLPHPPLSCVGNKYAWRSHDGSGNNVTDPDIGKAGSSYARSVAQAHPLPRHMLPDPGLIYDTLLRREKFTPHPAGLSSLMFSFATLVIHSVFRTRHGDVDINETSSYVDLAPLYGVDQKEQEKVRMVDGRGLLHPDVFSESRLRLLPPAVCVLLVLFNRNHNYIAKKLLEINERKRWKSLDDIPADAIKTQDNEIFQTARLINCGWFASVVFSDYFSAILGLVRRGNSWSLDVFSEFRHMNHSIFERGRGNVCSVEFNCLYRWHATTSEEDEAWVEKFMAKNIRKETDKITVDDFKKMMGSPQVHQDDVKTWTFGELLRKNGKFSDAGLGDILKKQTKHKAATFGARGTPSNMKLMEVMGIENARDWGCCSLNDFRTYLGLRPYKSFLEWNPQPEIAAAAEKLYGDIDHLELYAGLQAEDTKPVVKGAGLCPGYTISRAILADAVALIRGDRFFTADFTTNNLTAWGYADCTRSVENPGFGSMLGRLFLRTLPGEFTHNSSYAWFPLMTPEAMDEILTNLGQKDEYDLEQRLSSSSPRESKECGEVSDTPGDNEKFSYPFLNRVSRVIPDDSGFFLATGSPGGGEREQREIFKALAETEDQVNAITQFFFDNTKALISKNSYKLVGGKTSALDVVRDVFRVVPIQWVAGLACITLKKPEDDNKTNFTETELFDTLNAIYTFCFLDIEADQVLRTEKKIKAQVKQILDHIEANVGGSIVKRLSVNGVVGTLSRMFGNKQGFADRLQQGGNSTSHNVYSTLAVMVGASVELAQALAHMLDILLEEADVVKALASDNKPEVMEGYVAEKLRINPPIQGVYREAKVNDTVGSTSLNPGDFNAREFETLTNVDHSRPKDGYINSGVLTRTLGTELVSKIVANVLKAVFKLDNVQRGPGQSGKLKRLICEVEGIELYRYLDKDQRLSPWASSLVITYDDSNAPAMTG